MQPWVVGWKLTFLQNTAKCGGLRQAIVPKFRVKWPSESYRTISWQTSDGREDKKLCICRLKTQNGACSKNACSTSPRVVLRGDWFETSQWNTFDSKNLSKKNFLCDRRGAYRFRFAIVKRFWFFWEKVFFFHVNPNLTRLTSIWLTNRFLPIWTLSFKKLRFLTSNASKTLSSGQMYMFKVLGKFSLVMAF